MESENIIEALKRNNWIDEIFEPKPASEPTQEMIGTPERVDVYAKRVEAGESLWHPDDLVVLHEPQKNNWPTIFEQGAAFPYATKNIAIGYRYEKGKE